MLRSLTRCKQPISLVALPKRFEGGYPWYLPTHIKFAKDKPWLDDEYLEETEVETRMSQVIHKFALIDLFKLDWSADFNKCGVDEYEQTAILTSIEHEFHTIFEDRIFENFKNFNEVKRFILTDLNSF